MEKIVFSYEFLFLCLSVPSKDELNLIIRYEKSVGTMTLSVFRGLRIPIHQINKPTPNGAITLGVFEIS